jgi:hypothetical protein
MTVVVSARTGVVTRPLKGQYASVTVTLRRLRSTEWEAAREAAQSVIRDDGKLLPLLVEHDLLPKGGVKGWKRMRDAEPIQYALFLTGVAMWLTAVECGLAGIESWTGVASDRQGTPAPVGRAMLEVLMLDDQFSQQVMALLTEASVLVILEGKPSGASLSGSLEPARTASAPTTAPTA